MFKFSTYINTLSRTWNTVPFRTKFKGFRAAGRNKEKRNLNKENMKTLKNVKKSKIWFKRKHAGLARLSKLKSFVKPTEYAVVQIQNRQYKIYVGDEIICDKLSGEPDIGSQIRLHKVLLYGGRQFTAIGRPLVVPEPEIIATVVAHTRSRPIIVFKKKKRKRYMRWRGYRHPISILRIEKMAWNEETHTARVHQYDEALKSEQKPKRSPKEKIITSEL